jgi:predicted CoA-substrate-specific enzyme activase
VASAVCRTGLGFAEAAGACIRDLDQAVPGAAGLVAATVATGYGRHDVSFAARQVTEVSCLAAACHRLYPGALTIVDVGGQDTKIVRVRADGQRASFKMNRACASGTGAFLEEMAARLDVPLGRLDTLASAGNDPARLSSYCTVFAKSELVSLARAGRRLEDIALGVFDCMARRILELDQLAGEIVLTGGVAAHNPILARRVAALVGREVVVPDCAQLIGAVGAALVAQGGGSETG